MPENDSHLSGTHAGGSLSDRSPLAHPRTQSVSSRWRFYLLLFIGLIVSAALVLLAVSAFLELSALDLAGTPAIAWVALLIWLVIVRVIFYFLRKRK